MLFFAIIRRSLSFKVNLLWHGFHVTIWCDGIFLDHKNFYDQIETCKNSIQLAESWHTFWFYFRSIKSNLHTAFTGVKNIISQNITGVSYELYSTSFILTNHLKVISYMEQRKTQLGRIKFTCFEVHSSSLTYYCKL